jgi:hypothetical protein
MRVHRNCCGLDVHKKMIAAYLIREDAEGNSVTGVLQAPKCVLTDRQSAGQRPETLECGRADLAHFSHTNQTHRNRLAKKQDESGSSCRGGRTFELPIFGCVRSHFSQAVYRD